MRRLILSVLVLAAAPIRAQDPPAVPPADDRKSAEEIYAKIADTGTGVYKVKTDDKGRIVSCLVAGQSRISTALGAAKGRETAKLRAELAAKGAFIKWLQEKVEIHQKTEDETILFMEGAEGNDKATLGESGKAVEKTTQKIESSAAGLVRGFKAVYTEEKAADKSWTVIYQWDAKRSEAAKKIHDKLNPPDGSKNGVKTADGGLKDKKTVIDD